MIGPRDVSRTTMGCFSSAWIGAAASELFGRAPSTSAISKTLVLRVLPEAIAIYAPSGINSGQPRCAECETEAVLATPTQFSTEMSTLSSSRFWQLHGTTSEFSANQ